MDQMNLRHRWIEDTAFARGGKWVDQEGRTHWIWRWHTESKQLVLYRHGASDSSGPWDMAAIATGMRPWPSINPEWPGS